jgi:hypothetical protein
LCGHSFKTIFRIFENSPWEHYISKTSLKFWHEFLYFQNCKYKFFGENSPCFKSPFINLRHLRKACGNVVFLFQKSFLLIKCSLNHFNFYVNFNILHKKGSMCSKHSKNKNTYMFLDFDTQTSLSIIIILNL